MLELQDWLLPKRTCRRSGINRKSTRPWEDHEYADAEGISWSAATMMDFIILFKRSPGPKAVR